MRKTWRVEHIDKCDSTFIPARNYAPWTAVYTTEQSHGRGRFNRTWFGSKGGLWVCYNVPIDESLNLHWGVLPLVAGAALAHALTRYRIDGLRLRWPNDLLVGRAKLGGILVERPSKNMASIGIGLNIHNDIKCLQGKTTDPVTSLSTLLPNPPSVEEMCTMLAHAIDLCYEEFVEEGFCAIQDRMVSLWGEERPVVAITDTMRHCGYFAGVTTDGSPILRHADGHRQSIPGLEVNRLQELL